MSNSFLILFQTKSDFWENEVAVVPAHCFRLLPPSDSSLPPFLLSLQQMKLGFLFFLFFFRLCLTNLWTQSDKFAFLESVNHMTKVN